MDSIVTHPGDRAGTASPHIDQLRLFRERVYGCLSGRADALFGLADAVLCHQGRVSSFPMLSLEAVFGRGHGAAYGALAAGGVDQQALGDLLAGWRPAQWPLWFALDTTPWARPYAQTSPQRGWVHHSMRHTNGKPFVPGWCYQWLVQLSPDRDSWTAPLQARRIAPGEDPAEQAAAQIRDCVRRVGPVEQLPLFVADAGYDPVAITWLLWHQQPAAQPSQPSQPSQPTQPSKPTQPSQPSQPSKPAEPLPAGLLVRLRADRVFYRDPGPRRPGQRGTIARHGARFDLSEPATWGTPDQQLTCQDPRYGRVQVSAWHRLHPALSAGSAGGRYRHLPRPPIVPATIIRVQIDNPPRHNGAAHTHVLWLWYTGPQPADLDACWRAYLRRFDIEHTLRFTKTSLGWLIPAVRHPEQADRWTCLMLIVLTQLRLAKPIALTQRLPWQPHQPPDRLTPARVRSGFPRLREKLSTPARPRKNTRPGPGRPKGTHRGPALRHPVIKKTPQKR